MAEKISLAADFLDLADAKPVSRTTDVRDPRANKLDSPSIQM
jgi:hypothetical protein